MHIRKIAATLGMVGAMFMPVASFAQDTNTSAQMETTASMDVNLNFLRNFIDYSVRAGASADQGIDLAALRAHPCFEAVGAEQDYCLNMFGVQTDFSTMLKTNVITRSMVEQALSLRCMTYMYDDRTHCENQNATILPRLLIDLGLSSDTATGGFGGVTDGNTTNDGDDGEDVDVDESTVRESQYERAQRLWEMCEGHEMSQSGCYQTHLRFISDRNVTAEEMDEVIGNGRGTNNDDEEDDM